MQQGFIGILGASGYSGLEATRLLARHPAARLRFCSSDRWVGEPVAARAGLRGAAAGGAAGLTYVAVEAAEALFSGCDAVLLCTPAEVSHQMVPRVLAAGARAIDLSGAFRLEDGSAYPAHYGFEHAHPELLRAAAYGLPELFRERIRGARLVASPGCYATAAALALAPLLKAGLVDPAELIVDAASGVTGAGRKSSEEYSFAEVADDFRAYRVLRHQHTPEIVQTLARAAGPRAPGAPPVDLTFTPHLLPLRRGILATCYARLRPGASSGSVAAAFADAYGPEPFVELAPGADAVSIKAVAGTNQCLVGATCSGRRAVVVSALDNLVKGAAGQAVQNLNLALGWDESAGLDALAGRSP
ncbi:MAG TPA: N-acetyl-gamma-glutamyl-phosphate reductase [Myxococcales bacterium]|nr:N-acetyl-gamma-glutamyl-phosphate reductase [Myxococcales bacterium]